MQPVQAAVHACCCNKPLSTLLLAPQRARILTGTLRLGEGEAATDAAQPWEHVGGACPPDQAALAPGVLQASCCALQS